MMPSFRKDLFNNFIITENPNKKEELEKLTYSVIYNLQLTFMNLKYGSMSPYPPKRFIKSFLNLRTSSSGKTIKKYVWKL